MDVEQRLKTYIERKNLGHDDKICPLFSIVLEKINSYHPKEFFQLTKDEQHKVMDWYANFYKKIYKNYKVMIEITNFPTLKKYFKSYNNMPLMILLLDNGHKHIYRNITNQSECVNVRLMDEKQLH